MYSPCQILDVACDDSTALQEQLNALYSYKDDVSTKTYHRSRIALFQTLVHDLIVSGVIRTFDKAMDIGCNAGFCSKVISDFGFRDVLGIDINPSFIARARNSFSSDGPGKRIAFEIMDATAIPAGKHYDFILCTEVIEHTSSPEAVIKSIMTMLVPGGVAVISLPNCLSIGYLSSYLGAWLKRRGISPELRDHMSYPFYKGPRLFRREGATILGTAGVNCMFNDRLLLLLRCTSLLDPLIRFNFRLSRRWPFRCFAQFYFFVVFKTR